jgi:hypothetical protein
MRILVVSLLAAVLLAATASCALAQESGDSTPDSNVEPTQEAESSGGNTDWIRTVGFVGIIGVWGARGINSVKRNRRERERWAAESAASAASGRVEEPPLESQRQR